MIGKYKWAEDYKLWFEIAKKGGVFYVESLPLLFYRLSEYQVSNRKKVALQRKSWLIKQEIIAEVFKRNQVKDLGIRQFYDGILYLVDRNLMEQESASEIMYELIQKIIKIE